MGQETKPKTSAFTLDAHKRDLLRRGGMIALAVIIVLSTVLCACSVRDAALKRHVPFLYDGQTQTEGVYLLDMEKKQQNELVRKTHRHGQLLRFRYFCGTHMTFNNANGAASILFGNVPTNDCVLSFSIMDKDGTLLFRSDGVLPGQYVSLIRLYRTLPAGDHPCKVYVAAYSTQTNQLVGVQCSRLTIQIGG